MAVLDSIRVDEITARSREIQSRDRDFQVGRLVLKLFALIPFMLGWIVAKTVLAVVWMCVAVKAGWREAGGPAVRVRREPRGG